MPDRKVHVVLRKEDVYPERLADKIVMVIDTLFATTTIVTALAHGARQVLPALNHNEARNIAQAAGAGAEVVLAGELNCETVPRPLYAAAMRSRFPPCCSPGRAADWRDGGATKSNMPARSTAKIPWRA